jgi:S-formylglutathione hydrolase FrmB
MRGQGQPAALYVDVGIDDHPRTLGGNRRLHQGLGAIGVDHMYTERPGGHAWEYIRDALPEMLLFVAERLNGRATERAHVGRRPERSATMAQGS